MLDTLIHSPVRHGWLPLVSLVALLASPAPQADPLAAVQSLREGGCGGRVPAARALARSAALDRVARQWASGRSLAAAAAASGYSATGLASVQVHASDAELLPLLRHSQCRPLTDPALREIGIYRQGDATWYVVARGQAPLPAAGSVTAAGSSDAVRALELINAVRARGTSCGARAFAPAPLVTLSAILADAARAHASDMAARGYFEHQDPAGHSAADRVRATGYRERLVGENIAYGPTSIEEAVQGWLASPGHCENIMDPRFAQMAVASAPGHASMRGRFWVQVLAEPRA